ncbi:hypothetical protein [Azoarcus olearius]|uniref:Uncharacterized protein n=1 Tax=Azoarcus sp. (strain BH72) TaxID=418699 RepID=A1KCN4_AZOSB|nr:hypothetical protein [Azoarcus olearius]ANQ87133.1 hypothetical protein dqs_4117 [Azoarcus olearius]CAL96590.1 conserved hypothetical protein [Azoarcus olearius]
MPHVVIVAFGADREYEFTVSEQEAAALRKDDARAWLAAEFDALECSPSNPMGKILVLDMVLNVAKYGGESRFAQAGDWARAFVTAAAVVLDRPVIRIDVPGFTVG